MTWQFEPRLEHASTIPSRYYAEAAVLADEQRAIFAKTWQLAGRADQVREAGQFFTTTIANEPVLVIRGSDGVLRAMSNVCRHRAGPVAKGEGKRPVLQCGYHGWTYSLDGRLLKTPEFEKVQDFDVASCVLPQFRVETWLDLVFVNLDPEAQTLRESFGEVVDRVGHAGFQLAASKNWELDCNWKVYVDNYLEGYHIPIVHPSLFRELDYPRYWTETKRMYSIQHAPVKRSELLRSDTDVQYYWIFPNLMLNVYADNFSTNLILPLSHGRTLTVFEWFFRDPEQARKEIDSTIAFSDEIQIEDIEICEAVQRGLASSTYESGRYSPQRENGVHHFHGLYAEMMNLGFARSTRA
jgi:choline monooxygenase